MDTNQVPYEDNRWLAVKNWGDFQHYKYRNPPWIKLHNSLLWDFEFSKLSMAMRGLLIQLWLVASRFDGRVPRDTEELKFLLADNTIEPKEIDALVEAGFLVVLNASTVLYRVEKSREEREKSFSSSKELVKEPKPEDEYVWDETRQVMQQRKVTQ